jgi:hypothetical protein
VPDHHVDRARHDRFELLALHPRTRPDRDGVDGRGGELRRHFGIGCWRQFALFLRKAKAGRECLVEFGKSFQHHGGGVRPQ